jgi:CRISPR-associated protein Csb1
VKSVSRIDPAEIRLSAGPVYMSEDGAWTLIEAEAKKDSKGKPIKFGKDGKPSEVNHGNVTPSVDERGGFTIDHARRTTTLSLPALRRLRFPVAGGGPDGERDHAAHVALAALGLCAATLARDMGGDLRSRCHLVAESGGVWELIDRPGEPPKVFELESEAAIALYTEVVAAAKAAGLPWLDDELKLTPSPQLIELVRRSQELASSVVESNGES